MAQLSLKPVRSFSYGGCTYSERMDGSLQMDREKGRVCSRDTYAEAIAGQLKLIEFFDRHGEAIKAAIKKSGALCVDIPTMLSFFKQRGTFKISAGDRGEDRTRSEIGFESEGVKYNIIAKDSDRNGKVDSLRIVSGQKNSSSDYQFVDLLGFVAGREFEPLFETLLMRGAEACMVTFKEDSAAPAATKTDPRPVLPVITDPF